MTLKHEENKITNKIIGPAWPSYGNIFLSWTQYYDIQKGRNRNLLIFTLLTSCRGS